MPDGPALNGPPEDPDTEVVGVFRGPWDTGRITKDGAVLGFEDVSRAFSDAADAGDFKLVTADIAIFRDYRRIHAFLAACDVVYANCGPWAALLHLVRDREQLDVRIIREVRTVGWIGYIWQEEVASQLARPGDKRVFPSRYARDIWDATDQGVSESRIYYPMIRGRSKETPAVRRSVRTVGFFGRFSRDKGFDYLPGVISRLLADGHRINRLVLAGEQDDPVLYVSVVSDLSDIGVEVSFRGSLPNDQARALMAECDCILFLSVSSIESLGRVMVEASEQGVPVVTADFGAARDLVNAGYRIPVDYRAAASGHCDAGFPLAQLDLGRWEPPVNLTSDACFRHSVRQYSAAAQTPADILRSAAAELPGDPQPQVFSFVSQANSLELGHDLLDKPGALLNAPIAEMVDLGGTLKQYLLSNGYNPRVSFQPRAKGTL